MLYWPINNDFGNPEDNNMMPRIPCHPKNGDPMKQFWKKNTFSWKKCTNYKALEREIERKKASVHSILNFMEGGASQHWIHIPVFEESWIGPALPQYFGLHSAEPSLKSRRLVENELYCDCLLICDWWKISKTSKSPIWQKLRNVKFKIQKLNSKMISL